MAARRRDPGQGSLIGRRRVDSNEALRAAVGGSVVVVTGTSSGIGAAAARRLAAAGAEVVLVARSEDRLAALAAEIEAAGGLACAHPADLADTDAVADAVDSILRDHGGVDVLVSNAGLSIRRSIALSYGRFHDFQRTAAVNYLGPVRLVLGFLPGIREHGHGQIVNVSSMGVLFAAPRFPAYLASKSAFDAFLRCLSPEVAGDGVAVTNIYMPLVHTPMVEATRVYGLLPGLTPDEAAERVCRAIVTRPASVSSTLGRAGRLAYDAVPGVFGGLLRLTYRLSEDSAAARGEAGDDFEAPGFAQGLLRRIGRLTGRAA